MVRLQAHATCPAAGSVTRRWWGCVPGPCQFPTLGFVVERYFRVQNFVPEPFWRIQLTATKARAGPSRVPRPGPHRLCVLARTGWRAPSTGGATACLMSSWPRSCMKSVPRPVKAPSPACSASQPRAGACGHAFVATAGSDDLGAVALQAAPSAHHGRPAKDGLGQAAHHVRRHDECTWRSVHRQAGHRGVADGQVRLRWPSRCTRAGSSAIRVPRRIALTTTLTTGR
jgi:hypothetical protein